MVSVLPDTRNSGTSLEKFSAMFIFLKRFGSLEGLSAGLFFVFTYSRTGVICFLRETYLISFKIFSFFESSPIPWLNCCTMFMLSVKIRRFTLGGEATIAWRIASPSIKEM